MDGLKHLLFRVIPLITLICFVCFGITHAFQQQDEAPITYLETNYYDKSNGFVIIENPTEEQKEADTTLKVYEFNFTAYRNNIDQNILKRSVENTLTLEAYQWTLEQFNKIWDDGYQLFDVTKTIANAIVLVINTLILPINILLIPLRIISGILLTGISLIGININNSTIVAPILIFILDKLTIPFIQPNNTTNYQFYRNINEHYQGDQTIYLDFKVNEAIGKAIKIEQYSGSHVRMSYLIEVNNTQEWVVVFDSGSTGNAWGAYYDENSVLNISTMNDNTQEEQQIITQFLSNYGTSQ